ncbi:MAG: hypothetical protein PVH88_25220 [Ignavibacteria bacterium]|jgi:hypothetical protein
MEKYIKNTSRFKQRKNYESADKPSGVILVANWFWDFAIKFSLFKTCPPYETLGGGEDLGEF